MTSFTLLAVLSDGRTISTQFRATAGDEAGKEFERIATSWKGDKFYCSNGSFIIRFFLATEDGFEEYTSHLKQVVGVRLAK